MTKTRRSFQAALLSISQFKLCSMKSNKMNGISRIVIAVASLSLIATFFLPVWFIFLLAPQYPEGLTMNIWLNKITGQIEIINGLNHYIGMKHISVEMFPEFHYLIYIVAFFIVFGLLVAITGKRKLLFTYLILTVIGGGAALYDFYQWGYDYGHNLDPKAAIQVPGLTYQPPVIGHKRLLNFDAYSYPATGGWVVIGVGSCFFLVWVYEWYKNRKRKASVAPISSKAVGVAALISLISFTSCNTEPEKINYGKDLCSDCSMTIIEPQFASEIITKKGKIYKFDDVHCISHFIHTSKIKKEDIGKIVFVAFDNNDQFVDASTASFVFSSQLKSPMNGNTIAFAKQEAAQKKANETKGVIRNWNEIVNSRENNQHH